MKNVLIFLVAITLLGIFVSITPQGNLDATVQNFQQSLTTVVYAGELDEIRKAVDEFLVLRTIHGTEDGKLLAAKIDQRINNLELVKIHCNQEISTLELVYEKNPYEKLQQLCPSLKSISFSKAVQLFRLI